MFICINRLHGYSIYIRAAVQRYCSAPKLCSSGRSHIGSLFTNEEQKGLAHDVNDTCATHAGLLHDNTDSDSKWQRSQPCFHDFQL